MKRKCCDNWMYTLLIYLIPIWFQLEHEPDIETLHHPGCFLQTTIFGKVRGQNPLGECTILYLAHALNVVSILYIHYQFIFQSVLHTTTNKSDHSSSHAYFRLSRPLCLLAGGVGVSIGLLVSFLAPEWVRDLDFLAFLCAGGSVVTSSAVVSVCCGTVAGGGMTLDLARLFLPGLPPLLSRCWEGGRAGEVMFHCLGLGVLEI